MAFVSTALAAHRPEVSAPALDPLLARCIDGDRGAWRELHRQTHGTVVAFLRRLGVDESDLDDANQEVFVQVIRYLPRFKGAADFKTWLYRLCVTQASRLYRRRVLFSKVSRMFGWPRTAGVVPDGPLTCDLEERAQLAAALQPMSARLRRTFVLYELEGLSGQEIARIEECPLPTVWRRLHDARKIFERAVNENARGES